MTQHDTAKPGVRRSARKAAVSDLHEEQVEPVTAKPMEKVVMDMLAAGEISDAAARRLLEAALSHDPAALAKSLAALDAPRQPIDDSAKESPVVPPTSDEIAAVNVTQ
jgi:hypothetical protein